MRLILRPSPELFAPNPGGQRQFMDDYVHRYCALAGGWFAGKTWAGARKLADLHVLNAFDAAGRPTFVRGLVVAPTYSLALSVNVPELCEALRQMNLAFRWANAPQRFCFVLPDLGTRARPSEILVRSAEAPARITGFTVGHVWGDEVARWKGDDGADPTQDALLQCDGRLRDPAAALLQFNMTFTHEGDATRVYEDFERSPKADHALYRAGTTDNPHAAAFAAAQAEQLTPALRDQYLGGLARSVRGSRVYDAFDAGRNLDASLALDDRRPLQLSVDFNIDPGMHALVGQHDADADRLTAVYELHEPRMDVRRMAAALRQLIERDLGGWRWPVLEVFGDATGQGQWAGTGQSCYDLLCESLRAANVPYRLKVPRSNPPVVDRVNAVNCALSDLEGRVRYRVHPRCAKLIDDLRTLAWASDGGPDKRDRDRSHASDAEGYRVHWLMPVRRIKRVASAVGVV